MEGDPLHRGNRSLGRGEFDPQVFDFKERLGHQEVPAGRYTPKARLSASEISPSVARTSTARRMAGRRFSVPRALLSTSESVSDTASALRRRRSWSSFLSCSRSREGSTRWISAG